MPRPKKTAMPITKDVFDKLVALGIGKVELAKFFECGTAKIDEFCKMIYGKTFMQHVGIKTGRKKIAFDAKLFEDLCGVLCTEEEIASIMGCSVDTLTLRAEEHYKMRFTDVIKELSGNAKASVRRMQFSLAQKGDKSMLIWLGKQWLGQRDYQHEANDLAKEVQELKKAIFEHQKEMDEYKMG